MSTIHQLLLAILLTASLYHTTTAQSWDRAFIKDFILPMMPFVQPQEIAWFISEQLSKAITVDIEEFVVEFDGELKLTQTVLTHRNDKPFIATEMKKTILSIVFTSGPDDSIMDAHDYALGSRHNTFSFVIMLNSITDFGVVVQFLRDLRRRKFQNPMLYYVSVDGRNQIYGYTVFPRFEIVDRANYLDELSGDYKRFLAGGLDTMGYQICTPLRQDLPGVFHSPDASDKVSNWQGSSFSLLRLFTDYINATLVSYEMPKDRLGGNVVDIKAAMDLLRHDEITFLAHAYALFYEDDIISLSYPIGVVRWCLMVPIWNSVTTILYPLEPFDELTWLCIVVVFGALLLVQTLYCLLQGTHELATRLSDSILRSFCLSTGISAPSLVAAPKALDFFIFTTFFFYGFFLTANYTSLLGSILTVTSFRAQFNTMDDLIAYNLSVLIIDYELEFLHSGGLALPANFTRLIQPVDVATFIKYQYSFNTNYAYFVTEEKWHFLDLQQQYLKPGFFKFSKICFGTFFLAFPMQRDSLFYRSLEYYTFPMHSSGLMDHYERTAFDYAVHAGLVKRLAQNAEYTSAGMQHLIVVFLMLLTMYAVSLLVFLLERLGHRVIVGTIPPKSALLSRLSTAECIKK
uniref:Ionotropic glutamate receptor n=1 Tax=Bactrocera latifrons TaxID=174628 RepID=A0A0K8W6R1_BACLA